jgi:hypothetical protein
MKPPDYIINAAKRGLELLDYAGDGLTEGTKYCYRMRAVASDIKSDYTTKFCGTTKAAPAPQDPAPNPSATPTASAAATPTASPSPKVIVLAP